MTSLNDTLLYSVSLLQEILRRAKKKKERVLEKLKEESENGNKSVQKDFEFIKDIDLTCPLRGGFLFWVFAFHDILVDVLLDDIYNTFKKKTFKKK